MFCTYIHIGQRWQKKPKETEDFHSRYDAPLLDPGPIQLPHPPVGLSITHRRATLSSQSQHVQNDGISFSGFDGCFWHLEYLVYLSTMLESCSNCLLHHLVSLPLQLQDSTADTLLIWWAWPLSRDKSVFVGFHSNMFLSPLCVETFPSSFLTLFNFRGIHFQDLALCNLDLQMKRVPSGRIWPWP